MDPTVCRAQSGVLTSTQAADVAGRGVVRGHVRLGRWRQICPGILLTGNGELTRAQQHWVAVLVAGQKGRLAGAAAAVAGGLRGIHAEQIPVLIPAVRGVSRKIPRLPPDMPAVRVYRSAVLPSEHCRTAGSHERRWPDRWSTRQRGHRRIALRY